MHPRPWTLGLRTTETPLPYWWFSEGDTQESGDKAVVWHWQGGAADSTRTCLNDEVCVTLGGAHGDKEKQEEDWGQKKNGGLHDGGRDDLCGWRSVHDSFSSLGGRGLLCFPSVLQREREREREGEIVM